MPTREAALALPARRYTVLPMRLQVKGRNLEVSEQIRKYAEDKLGKLDKLVKDPTRVELELAVEKNPSISDNHVAEATVWTKGPVLRARESSGDMKASIDQLVSKLERQDKRYREKRRVAPRRHAAPQPAEPAPLDVDEDAVAITKTKQFTVNPMTPDEAVLQLELVGHDFFVFRSAESHEINVVYRRRDGRYGLIEPQ
jgi:putative sigma-54 modulation protein